MVLCLGTAFCCIGSAVCCAGRQCCNCLCWCCNHIGIDKRVFSRIGYIFIAAIFSAISILLLFTVKEALDWTGIDCPEEAGGGSVCMGVSAVFRMSFAQTLFHLLMFLICLTRTTIGSAFNDGCWLTKTLIILGFFILSMWIPNDFFIGWGHFSRFASALYLFF